MHVAALGLQSNVIYLFFLAYSSLRMVDHCCRSVNNSSCSRHPCGIDCVQTQRDREREALQQGPRIDALELESAKVRDHSFIGH